MSLIGTGWNFLRTHRALGVCAAETAHAVQAPFLPRRFLGLVAAVATAFLALAVPNGVWAALSAGEAKGAVSPAPAPAPDSAARRGKARVKPALVKVYTTANPADLLSPWQGLGTEKYTGTGVIISGSRILTNAHLVADQVSIEVKRQGMTRKYEARPLVVGHACDLALLQVDDPAFFEGVVPLEIGAMPAIQDTVDVYGFPVGGESISVTSGIVSRIEIGPYSHSEEELLIAQVDAALNPGNSGGPVIESGKLAGIALQILDGAENVGYVIPAPVVRHFLADVEDGRFDGFPTLGIDWQSIENPALRSALGLEQAETGGLVSRVNGGSSADGVLEAGDVLLSIDGHEIAEDLTIALPGGGRIGASYAVQRRQAGDEIEIGFVRGNRRILQTVLLQSAPILVPGPAYDRKPTYLVFGGLVFQPLSLDYIDALYDWQHDLAYYAFHQYLRTEARHEVILLSQVLAGPVNRGYHDWANAILATVDGRVPRDMRDLVSIIEGAEGPWLDVVTEEGQRLTLDLTRARAAGPQILERYGIARDRSPDLSRPR